MSETIRQAELAMGSSARVMDDYAFQKRHGWHTYWTPDGAIKWASMSPRVKSLIWC
jgi:hypothetical protein